ncbi:unnamed protein product [Rhodiola kirilowii]
MTPFQAVYGQPPPAIKEYIPGLASNVTVDHLLTMRTQLLDHLKTNLRRAQHRMQQQANKHRTDVEFQEGQWVYVKLQPYRQTSLRDKRCSKLAKRYYGPFRIIEHIGKVAYKLEQLPAHAKIHNVFHVSILTRCVGELRQESITWPDIFTGPNPMVQPEHILAVREVKKYNNLVTQVLVQWQHQAAEDATWEDIDYIREQFPIVRLEDKALLDAGSNDTCVRDHNEQGRGARHKIRSTKYPEHEFITNAAGTLRERGGEVIHLPTKD